MQASGKRWFYALAFALTIGTVWGQPYRATLHVQTPHFLAYKAGAQVMVKSLEFVEVDPFVPK